MEDKIKKRIFIDMDGTLAEFKPVSTLEALYEKNYFSNLKPMNNVLEAVKMLCRDPNLEVYILSSVLSDSRYALEEKNAWLDRYLPEVPEEKRLFPNCGQDKKESVPGGVRRSDHLLDDYTHNLMLWEPPAKGIKILNGINHTKGTWKGRMVQAGRSAVTIAEDIIKMLNPEKETQQTAGKEYSAQRYQYRHDMDLER